MATTKPLPLLPDDPAFREELDPEKRAEKFEHEFEESSEVEPAPQELNEPPDKPA